MCVITRARTCVEIYMHTEMKGSYNGELGIIKMSENLDFETYIVNDMKGNCCIRRQYEEIKVLKRCPIPGMTVEDY